MLQIRVYGNHTQRQRQKRLDTRLKNWFIKKQMRIIFAVLAVLLLLCRFHFKTCILIVALLFLLFFLLLQQLVGVK